MFPGNVLKRGAIVWLLFLWACLPIAAQVFKYYGVTDGLSDRRVLSLQKDSTGYMWLLTYTGIDRFDGKNIKHYRLVCDDGYVAFYSEKNILKTDSHGQVWTVSPDGRIFHYDPLSDDFEEIPIPEELRLQIPEMTDITQGDEVWLCYPGYAFVYAINKREMRKVALPDKHRYVVGMCQSSEGNYFIGSTSGLAHMKETDGRLEVVNELVSDSIFSKPQILYYHPLTSRLLVGSTTDGILVYDFIKEDIGERFEEMADFPVTTVFPYDRDKVLLSTLGAGVFLYDFRKNTLEQYLIDDLHEPNGMNGNHIRTLYYDEDERLWMSVYPVGVTVYDKAYPAYKWYKHHIGNPNSLGNDQVNHVIEDSEGDLWFATASGVSIYHVAEQTWERLSVSQTDNTRKRDYTFLSLCEVSPGIIWAGGYMAGIYQINKKTRQVQPLTAGGNSIRVIYKDNEGCIWTGGSSHLRCTDPATGEEEDYPMENGVTCLVQQDSATLLVGTGDGIFRLDKRQKKVKRMRMPFPSQHINAMLLHSDGDLYIGTANSGLVVLHADGDNSIYTYKMSALLNDIINTMLPQGEKHLILTTEQNVALFDIEKKVFYNWTEDQGLIEANFNPRAAVHTARGTYVFGTNMGAIEFDEDITLPKYNNIKVVIDQILVDNKRAATLSTVRQSAVTDVNSIEELQLSHDQNSLAIHLTGINYGNPQYTYFQWKLWGKTDYWTQGGGTDWVQLRHLEPGEYLLHVQNIAQEDYRVIGEKKLRIVISPSFWDTGWAILLYLLCTGTLTATLIYIFRLRHEQNLNRGRTKHFMNAVIRFRVPLALIRVSLDKLFSAQADKMDIKSRKNLKIATDCLEQLHNLSAHMLQTEGGRQYGRDILTVKLRFEEFIQPVLKQMGMLAERRGQTLQFESSADLPEVWIDDDRMQHILKTLLAATLRFTPAEGRVRLSAFRKRQKWIFAVTNEQGDTNVVCKRRDSLGHYNKSVLKDELYLLSRLVKSHAGRLYWHCGGDYSYTFMLEFPLEHSRYVKSTEETLAVERESVTDAFFAHYSPIAVTLPSLSEENKRGYLLIVDDDPGVATYLGLTLSDDWDISMAQSASLAMDLIRNREPDIILCGLINLQNPTEDLCLQLKSNFDTSHIPIILMTPDDNSELMAGGVRLRADHYINKILDLHLVSSILVSVLENRRQLQERLAKADIQHGMHRHRTAEEVREETRFMEQLKQFVESHISDPQFGVDDLCPLMGMSRTSLYNKVRDLTGKTPSDMIRDARMHYAAGLLLSEQYSISEVSDLLGFSETKYFREIFRKHFGQNPSEYLKQHLKNNKTEQHATDEDLI